MTKSSSWTDALPGIRERREAEALRRREQARVAGRANVAKMSAAAKRRFAAMASMGGKARARTMDAAHFERLKSWSSAAGKASQAKKTPEERREFARLGAAAALLVVTPEQRRANGRKGAMALNAEQRIERSRRGAIIRWRERRAA